MGHEVHKKTVKTWALIFSPYKILQKVGAFQSLVLVNTNMSENLTENQRNILVACQNKMVGLYVLPS